MPLLAWKIVEKVLSKPPKNVSVALIAPSIRGIDSVIQSINNQLEKKLKRKGSLRWLMVSSADQEKKNIYKEMGIGVDLNREWKPRADTGLSSVVSQIQSRTVRLAKLRGIVKPTQEFAAAIAQATLHANRAHTSRFGQYEITTIHAAKNREFDHVFVLWNYRVKGSDEKKRRLLYNAITRAKESCTLLIQRRDPVELERDPVLGLLEPVCWLGAKRGKTKGISTKKTEKSWPLNSPNITNYSVLARTPADTAVVQTGVFWGSLEPISYFERMGSDVYVASRSETANPKCTSILKRDFRVGLQRISRPTALFPTRVSFSECPKNREFSPNACTGHSINRSFRERRTLWRWMESIANRSPPQIPC